MAQTNTTSGVDQAKMEKYRKVRSEREAVPDGIIRVNRNIQARVFIDQVLEEFNTNNKATVTLSSLGEAITKSVTIAEIVKHRVAGLHQVNEISTIVIDDEYEPIEEGLEKMTVSRKLTCLQIVLSKKAPADTGVPGYQEPIPDSEVNPDAGPEDDGRRNNNRTGRRSKTQNPPEKSTEEEKKATETPAGDDNEENKGGNAKSGGNRRRRGGNRGGSQENRQGGGRSARGGRGKQGGGDNQAQGAAQQNNDSYNPFPDNKGSKGNAENNDTPAGDQQNNNRRGGGDGRRGGNRGGDGGQSRRGGGGDGGQGRRGGGGDGGQGRRGGGGRGDNRRQDGDGGDNQQSRGGDRGNRRGGGDGQGRRGRGGRGGGNQAADGNQDPYAAPAKQQ